MGDHRIVVCFDVEAESLTDAYGRLYRTLGKIDREGFTWESSDEAYSEGGDVTPEEMQEARMAFFASDSQAEAANDETWCYLIEEERRTNPHFPGVYKDDTTWVHHCVHLTRAGAEEDSCWMNRAKKFRIRRVRLA